MSRSLESRLVDAEGVAEQAEWRRGRARVRAMTDAELTAEIEAGGEGPDPAADDRYAAFLEKLTRAEIDELADAPTPHAHARAYDRLALKYGRGTP